MNGLKKRIIMDLIVTPFTIFPLIAGISALLLSEMLGSIWAFAGVCSCLIGLGGMITNFAFNFDKISRKAFQELREIELRKHNSELDELDRKLVKTTGVQDQECLRNLRSIYNSFQIDLVNGKIKTAPKYLIEQIDQIYLAVIHHLNRQYELWETSLKVVGELKVKFTKQRKSLLGEIEESISGLAETISEIRALGLKTGDGELTRLQDRLESQLNVAKATEQRLAEITGEDEYSRFKEYDTQ